jgi:hypothetical protein
MPASGCTVDDAPPRPDRELASRLKPGLQLLACPSVHSDLAPAAALALADEHGSTSCLEISLGKVERFADPQPGSAQNHDQRSQASAIGSVAGGPHDRPARY